jgi:tetratricopeptide (TPR) repeat protein
MNVGNFLWAVATAAPLFVHGIVDASGQANDLALCRSRDGDPIQRIIGCNRFIEGKGRKSNEELALAYNTRAGLHKGREDYRRAIDDYSAAIKLNGRQAVYYMNRSDTFLYAKQPDRALADANEAIRLDPNDETGYFLRATALRDKGDCFAAIEDYTRAITRDATLSRTFVNRATCYERIGNPKAAIEDNTQALQLEPDDYIALNNRGIERTDIGHYDEAIRDLSEALRLNPKNALTLYNRAYAYRETFQYDRALTDYDASLALDPKHLGAAQGRGVLLARMGRDREALAQMQQALAIDPGDAGTQDLLERIRAKLSTGPAAPGQPATPGKRAALVIGNSAYKFTSALANPANDAGDIAKTLRELGFDVVVGINLDRERLNEAIREFARKLDDATLGIVFYAGHGLQVEGKNYLLPVDAKIERKEDLDLATVELGRILERMESKRRVSIVFLDACRDNPLSRSPKVANASGRGLGPVKESATRSVDDSQGLAAVRGAAGTLIAYSTQPDNVALDGEGRNSPFATALLKYIATPGLEIESMMKQVRLDVIAATDQKQVPWGHSSLVGNVYLRQP